MPQDEIEESVSESESGHATSPEIDPHAHILSIKLPNFQEQASVREQAQLDKDTYFPMNDAIIIVEGFESIKKKMDEYAADIKKYNDKLKDSGVDFRIKAIHQHRYRHYNYYYFGNYIYVLKDIADEEIILDTITDTSLPIKKKSKKKTVSKKNNKKKSEDGDTKKWEYHDKFDYSIWRQIVGDETVKEIGLPPKMDIQSIKFHIVKKGEDGTNTIILPYLTYMNSSIKNIFDTCPAYRLS